MSSACNFPLPPIVAFPGLPAIPSLSLPIPDLSFDIGIAVSIPLPTIAFPGLPSLPALPIPALPDLDFDLGIPLSIALPSLPAFPPGLPSLPSLSLPTFELPSCPLDP